MSTNINNISSIISQINDISSIVNSAKLQDNLSPQVKNILNSLTDNKQNFTNIHDTLKKIVNDEKIDKEDKINIDILKNEVTNLVINLNIDTIIN
jgi:DNA-binding transcriptional regulator GbsR (MarR family)